MLNLPFQKDAGVSKRDLQRSMYELRGASLTPRFTIAALGAACVVLAWWLLLGGGMTTAGAWFGRRWRPGSVVRRAGLGAAFSIYYVRILFTEFVFLKRGVGWSEALTIAPWMLAIYVLLAIAGGTRTGALGLPGAVGIGLFLLGSWMNSYSEYARHVWRHRPENPGATLHPWALPLVKTPELSRGSHLILGNLPDFCGLDNSRDSGLDALRIRVRQHSDARLAPSRPIWRCV